VSNIEIGALAASKWRAQLGASVLLASPAISPQGTAMSGAGFGTGPCTVAMSAARRPRPQAVVVGGVPALAYVAGQLGQQANNQTHTYKKYLTSVSADGVGAADPPRRRGPA